MKKFFDFVFSKNYLIYIFIFLLFALVVCTLLLLQFLKSDFIPSLLLVRCGKWFSVACLFSIAAWMLYLVFKELRKQYKRNKYVRDFTLIKSYFLPLIFAPVLICFIAGGFVASVLGPTLHYASNPTYKATQEIVLTADSGDQSRRSNCKLPRLYLDGEWMFIERRICGVSKWMPEKLFSGGRILVMGRTSVFGVTIQQTALLNISPSEPIKTP